MKFRDDRFIKMPGGRILRRQPRNREDLCAWLEADDLRSREWRAERLAFLMDAQGESTSEWTVHEGGLLTMRAFEEARRAFMDGSYLATILLVQVWLEKTLVSMGRAAGDDVETFGLRRLLEHAVNKGILSSQEAIEFDELRQLRNPYAHGRAPVAEDTVEYRAVMTNVHPEDLLAEDARFALWLMLDLKRRRPLG